MIWPTGKADTTPMNQVYVVAALYTIQEYQAGLQHALEKLCNKSVRQLAKQRCPGEQDRWKGKLCCLQKP